MKFLYLLSGFATLFNLAGSATRCRNAPMPKLCTPIG